MTAKLDIISSKVYQTLPIGSSPKIDRLPEDVFIPIFSFLSIEDSQACTLVNRKIKAIVTAKVNVNEVHSIRKFITALVERLNVKTGLDQRAALLTISSQICFETRESLLLVKRYALSVKKQLINVLKTLDEETTNNLNTQLQIPHFFEGLFVLVSCERRIDQVDAIVDKQKKTVAIQDVCERLLQSGNLDRAMAFARTPSDNEERGARLQEVSKALEKAGDIDKAVAVATLILHEQGRGARLQEISRALEKAHNIHKAIAISTLISDQKNLPRSPTVSGADVSIFKRYTNLAYESWMLFSN